MKSLRSDRILNANYPLRFISSVIKQLDDKLSRKFIEKDDYILPPDFYEKKKQGILIEVPYFEKNETSSQTLSSKISGTR